MVENVVQCFVSECAVIQDEFSSSAEQIKLTILRVGLCFLQKCFVGAECILDLAN